MIKLRFLASTFAILLLTDPGVAKDCPPMEPPPGVRMPERAGCKAPSSRSANGGAKAPSVKAGREPGFIELGNGLQVRVSGQVDVEARHRR